MHVLMLLGRLAGGAPEVCLQVIRHLPSDIDISVAYLGGQAPKAQAFAELDVPLYRLADSPSSVEAPASLYRLLDEGEFDLLHTHMMIGGLYGRPIGSLAAVPVIHTQHTNYAHRPLAARVLDVVSAPFGEQAVCVSNSVEASLPWFYVSDTAVVHNCVDVPAEGESDWETLDWTETVDRSAPVIANVARYDPKKRRGDLIDGFDRLVESYPDAQLVLTGKPNGHQRELAAKVATCGLEENVKFVGFVDDPHTVYSHSDIVVSPSESEGFSISMLEAMAHECPIVATDIPAFTEALGATYPGLVPLGAPDALTEEMSRILSDPAYRERLIETVSDRITEFSGPRAAAKYASHYRQWASVPGTE